jgi:hypothetical protein
MQHSPTFSRGQRYAVVAPIDTTVIKRAVDTFIFVCIRVCIYFVGVVEFPWQLQEVSIYTSFSTSHPPGIFG